MGSNPIALTRNLSKSVFYRSSFICRHAPDNRVRLMSEWGGMALKCPHCGVEAKFQFGRIQISANGIVTNMLLQSGHAPHCRRQLSLQVREPTPVVGLRRLETQCGPSVTARYTSADPTSGSLEGFIAHIPILPPQDGHVPHPHA
jgi:hypothetical protein